jgi:hypothetical protein
LTLAWFLLLLDASIAILQLLRIFIVFEAFPKESLEENSEENNQPDSIATIPELRLNAWHHTHHAFTESRQDSNSRNLPI